jgi:hypothetical protein
MLFILEPKRHQQSFADINLENEIKIHKLQRISSFLFMADICKRRHNQLVARSFDQVNVTMCDQLNILYAETIQHGEEQWRTCHDPEEYKSFFWTIYELRQNITEFYDYQKTHPNVEYSEEIGLKLANVHAWFCKRNAVELAQDWDEDLKEFEEKIDKKLITTNLALGQLELIVNPHRNHIQAALNVLEASTISTTSPFGRKYASLCWYELYCVHRSRRQTLQAFQFDFLDPLLGELCSLSSAVNLNPKEFINMSVPLFKTIHLLPNHCEEFEPYSHLEKYLATYRDDYDHKNVTIQAQAKRLEFLNNDNYQDFLFCHVTMGERYETKQPEEAYRSYNEAFQLMLSHSIFKNHEKTMEFCIGFTNMLLDMKEWEYVQIVERFTLGCYDGQWETEEDNEQTNAEFHKQIQSKKDQFGTASCNSLTVVLDTLQSVSNSWELTCFLLLMDIRRLKGEIKRVVENSCTNKIMNKETLSKYDFECDLTCINKNL